MPSDLPPTCPLKRGSTVIMIGGYQGKPQCHRLNQHLTFSTEQVYVYSIASFPGLFFPSTELRLAKPLYDISYRWGHWKECTTLPYKMMMMMWVDTMKAGWWCRRGEVLQSSARCLTRPYNWILRKMWGCDQAGRAAWSCLHSSTAFKSAISVWMQVHLSIQQKAYRKEKRSSFTYPLDPLWTHQWALVQLYVMHSGISDPLVASSSRGWAPCSAPIP